MAGAVRGGNIIVWELMTIEQLLCTSDRELGENVRLKWSSLVAPCNSPIEELGHRTVYFNQPFIYLSVGITFS